MNENGGNLLMAGFFACPLHARRHRKCYFSNSLMIHQVKTKENATVKEVWIPGLN